MVRDAPSANFFDFPWVSRSHRDTENELYSMTNIGWWYDIVAVIADRDLQTSDVNDVGHKTKPKLKADKDNGTIIIDDETTLTGIPKEAWEYKLGNRSALEWVLDQYKESTPSDPTIAEKFNTYKFADYKDKVIDLLMRVTTVSVETMKIVREMEKE